MYIDYLFEGLQADEIHLCGEAGAIELVEEICNTTGEEMEVRIKQNKISKIPKTFFNIKSGKQFVFQTFVCS